MKKFSNLSLFYIPTDLYHLFICLSYHCLTLPFLSFFLHLSPFFLSLFLASIIFFNLFPISNLFHFIFHHSILWIYGHVFTWRLGVVDWLRKSLCSLLLLLSSSILDKNKIIWDWSIDANFYFIFYYCLINLKIICADSRNII